MLALPFPSLRFRLAWEDEPGTDDEDGMVVIEGGVGAPVGDGPAVWGVLEEASGVALLAMAGESTAGGSRKLPGGAVVVP